jgi:hypothetical protein
MVHVGACVEHGQTQVQSSHMLNENRCMIGIYTPRFGRKDHNPFYTIFNICNRYYLLHVVGSQQS